MAQSEMLCLSRKAARRDHVIFFVSTPIHHRLIGAAEARHSLDQRVEHRLEIDGRAADSLEHVCGGGLPLQGFLGLVEQPRVFDSDHCLIGEGGQKLDLLVIKRPNSDTAYDKYSNRVAFAKKWNAEVRAKTAQSLRLQETVIRVSENVRDLNRLALQ